MSNALVYRGFTQAALDRAYDNRAAVPDHMKYRESWGPRSKAVYAGTRCDRDVQYGPGARQRFDFFHCGRPDAPTFAYIHGGYWQWNDKEPHAFVGEGLLASGVNLILVEYTLAPAARMGEISEEIRSFVRFTLPALRSRFGASDRLVVGGHSAGGHLTAIATEVPGLAGALAISGLYDLEPIRLSYLNEPIRMTPEEARRNSPVHRDQVRVPTVVTVGGSELDELRRQSAEYAARLASLGWDVRHLVTPGDNHFSILERLARADGDLARAVLDLAFR